MLNRLTDKGTQMKILRFLYNNDGIYVAKTSEGTYSYPAYHTLLEEFRRFTQWGFKKTFE